MSGRTPKGYFEKEEDKKNYETFLIKEKQKVLY
jgi:hypothetical protein